MLILKWAVLLIIDVGTTELHAIIEQINYMTKIHFMAKNSLAIT